MGVWVRIGGQHGVCAWCCLCVCRPAHAGASLDWRLMACGRPEPLSSSCCAALPCSVLLCVRRAALCVCVCRRVSCGGKHVEPMGTECTEGYKGEN